MRPARLAGAVAVLLLVPAAPAPAAVFPVTNANELRDAIDASHNNGESDTINVEPGTYDVSGELLLQGEDLIGEDLTIQGDGAAGTIIRQTAATRVFRTANTADDVEVVDLTITGGNSTGSGGGILNGATSGDLIMRRVAVEGNRATPGGNNSGGGGIYNEGGLLEVFDSSVSGNTVSIVGTNSGGGGIWSTSGATIENSTLSGNVLNATGFPSGSGGGAYYTLNGGGTLTNVTIAGNSASPSGGGIFNAGADLTLQSSILAGNSAPAGSNCAPAAAFASGDGNLEGADTCGLGPNELRNTDPRLGPLANNGGGTKTRALQPDSPAIDAGGPTCFRPDQRGAPESSNGCDIGAYEFDGLAEAAIPNCTPTGSIPVTMTAAPGEGVDGVNYRVDGGPELFIPTPPGPTDRVTIPIEFPEGRQQLEYWGDFNGPGGDAEAHQFGTVLVDKTRPQVDIQSEQRRSIYVITRRASIDVAANDALSGLVGDPSANGERIGTSSRGRKVVTKTATDLCGHQTTDTLSYRVLGPGLGTRAVLEPLGGRVRVSVPARGAARTAQKGRRFVAISQPREVPVGSLLDTRRGRLRLTSSRSRRATAIQDGQFLGGIFQVVQSRRRSARGLTELRLKGSSFRSCLTAGGGARASLSRRAIRRLRSNARGRFRTRGRFSAATVRGTAWITTDRCDGTLTRVTRGRVAVRDSRLRRTIVLRRGKSYLARAPGGTQP